MIEFFHPESVAANETSRSLPPEPRGFEINHVVSITWCVTKCRPARFRIGRSSTTSTWRQDKVRRRNAEPRQPVANHTLPCKYHSDRNSKSAQPLVKPMHPKTRKAILNEVKKPKPESQRPPVLMNSREIELGLTQNVGCR